MSPSLAPPLGALTRFAAAIAHGDETLLRERAAALAASGIDGISVDELLLQSVLTVGWPRALVAAAVWRDVSGIDAMAGEDFSYQHADRWTERGIATARTIYGEQYSRLRENLRRLHPALEAWVITEGYGRTISRPGLALAWRELCTVAQCAVLRTLSQTHSHLLGAQRAGASTAMIDAVVHDAGALLSDPDRQALEALWQRVGRRALSA